MVAFMRIEGIHHPSGVSIHPSRVLIHPSRVPIRRLRHHELLSLVRRVKLLDCLLRGLVLFRV